MLIEIYKVYIGDDGLHKAIPKVIYVWSLQREHTGLAYWSSMCEVNMIKILASN